MAALLLGTVGGPHRDDLPGASVRFDLQARSREFLRRGLFLSGAIHLGLLFAFLNLHGGAEVLAPSYSRGTEIFRQPPPVLFPLPPNAPRVPTAPPSKQGIVDPVGPKAIKLPPVDFKGVGVAPEPPSDGATGQSGSVTEVGNTAPFDPDRVFQEAEVDVPPVAVEAPKPVYPPIAKDQWITGRVMAEVMVKADGTVARVRIKSGNTILAGSVQETLYRWRFKPAMVQGRPVSVWVEIPVNFTL